MAQGKKTGGRIKGTPNRATVEVKVAAQVYTQEAVETLAKIMRDSASDQAKVAAVKELLDRAHGKPKQSVDVDANVKAAVAAVEWRVIDPSAPSA